MDSRDRDGDATTKWLGVIKRVMAVPGMVVERDKFLRSNLRSHCDDMQIDKAIDANPATAGVPIATLDSLADACRKSHVAKASVISFAAGVPGGWWMAATIPADLVQFHGHALVLAQKLAYLYGWPEFFKSGADSEDHDADFDEETLYILTLMHGTMMGADAARKGVTIISQHLAKVVATSSRKGFVKHGIYNLLKVGSTGVTKAAFARSVAKAIPVIGGLVSGIMTAAMLNPMANRLKDHLRDLPINKPREAVRRDE